MHQAGSVSWQGSSSGGARCVNTFVSSCDQYLHCLRACRWRLVSYALAAQEVAKNMDLRAEQRHRQAVRNDKESGVRSVQATLRDFDSYCDSESSHPS